MIQTSAPSNIALIKYMGKIKTNGNIASNPSLSITTDHLKTYIEISKTQKATDHWQPLEGYLPIQLSEQGQKRYLTFLTKLKGIFAIEEPLLVKTANTFPSDAGLASSASSFAAVTKAAYLYASEKSKSKAHKSLSIAEDANPNLALAKISRSGSGSSCRSLFGPACIWDGDEIYQYNNIPDTLHLAVIVETEKKVVSSSKAHQLIQTSLLNEGRQKRATTRLRELLGAFDEKNWQAAYEICWQEFWDMHTLFETSKPHFSFMKPESLEVLRYAEQRWQHENQGPIVTMDAGPNVHFFFPKEKQDLYETYKTYFKKRHEVLAQI